MNTDEFEHVRAAVQKAGAMVRDATREHCAEHWDYLVVVVPPFEPHEKAVTLAVMSSVPPQELPDFTNYIQVMLRRAYSRGMVMDETPSTERPS